MTKETTATIRFEATVIKPDTTADAGSFVYILLPRSAKKGLSLPDSTMVEGTINGFPFRAALELDGIGDHRLAVSEAIHDGAGVDPDGTAWVEVTRIGEEPEIRAPAELHKALGAVPSAQEAWRDITPLARRDWILWITTAKKPETRTRRIEKACDMLTSGKRRVCCFPGLKWLTKDHVTPDETWLPLPKI